MVDETGAGTAGASAARSGCEKAGHQSAPRWQKWWAPVLVVMVVSGLLVLSMALWFSTSKTVPQDFGETSVPAFAVSHGVFHCAYSTKEEYPIPPLYPVVAGSVMAVTGIGDMRFPVSPAVGKDCPSADVSTFGWHGGLFLIWLLGLLGWFSLLAGLLLTVRASGRELGRPVFLGVCLMACTPPVAATLMQDFHPEDLLAMGLILAGLAAAIRRRWALSGVLLGLACCTKQYSLLALIPLVVVSQGRSRRSLLAGCAATCAFIVFPLGIVMGKGMVDALLGANATPAGQGTLIGTTGFHGWALVIASRGCPLLLSAVVAFWARRRLGAAAMEPAVLIDLIATALALRLVFEVSLFDYYFLALSVALIAADMIKGRLRLETATWIIVAGVLFSGVEPIVRMQLRFPVPLQLLVVLSGLTLAARPLWQASALRQSSDTEGLRSYLGTTPLIRKMESISG